MSDSTEKKLRTEPWLLTLCKAQVLNPPAEELGKMNWFLFLYLLFLLSMCLSVPFMFMKLSSTMEMANPGNYPGIEKVLPALRDSGRDFSIRNGLLETAPGTPAQETVEGWNIVWETAGGLLPEKLVPGSIYFSREAIRIEQDRGTDLAGSLRSLKYYRLSEDKAPGDLLTRKFLYWVVMGNTPSELISIIAGLSVYAVLFALVLGFFLSLSGLRIGFSSIPDDSPRRAGFSRSIRSATAVLLGPAMLCMVIALMVPGLGPMALLIFSFIGCLRVIYLYINRFPDKKKKVD